MFASRHRGTVIAKGLKIVGSVTAEGLVEVNGQIDGELHCTSLVIARGAHVHRIGTCFQRNPRFAFDYDACLSSQVNAHGTHRVSHGDRVILSLCDRERYVPCDTFLLIASNAE